MGLFDRLSSVVSPQRIGAQYTSADYTRAFLAGDDVPEPWLGWRGGVVNPEHACTLTHVYSAALIISDDLGTSSCQTFRDLGNDGRARVKYSDPGIGGLAYRLRWAPNSWQTAKAFWSTMAWQFLLRPTAYAELIYRPGSDSLIDQLIPRHPDRVKQERLANGRLRFALREADGSTRFVTQDEMLVIRNTSTDGLNAISRIQYGSRAIASGIALQDFTSNYFRKGATAALVATYKGDKEDEDEDALHKSLTRYMSGSENAGGVLLVPEDIDIKALGVDPEKSELLGLKNLSGRDVARLFKLPPNWLAIEGAQSYSSSVQDQENYVKRCQIPITVEFEQAIQRDCIVAKTTYFSKFNLDYLLRGDLLARAQAYEILIRSRVIRPSDARVREDYSPDPQLDKLSEGDYRPGSSSKETQGSGDESGRAPSRERSARADHRLHLLVQDQAMHCVRRERDAVDKLARKYPSDVDQWQAELKSFYENQATFIAEKMRVSMVVARAYAAQHGSLIEAQGVGVMSDSWQREEADELAVLVLDSEGAAA